MFRRQSTGITTLGLAALALVMAVGTGCTPNAGGQGGGEPGTLPCMDLHVMNVSIDADPDWIGGDEETIVYEYADFLIKWSFNLDGNLGDSGSFPYNTLVQIKEDSDVVWETLVESDPIYPAEVDWDSVLVEGGLPYGQYTVSVHVDPDGQIFECTELVSALNNFKDIELDVALEPIGEMLGNGGESPSRN